MLSTSDRGALESFIDHAIGTAKAETQIVDSEFSKELHLEKPGDFVFGMIIGEITIAFSSYYNQAHGQFIDDVIRKEVAQIIIRRLPEMRQAIYFEE